MTRDAEWDDLERDKMLALAEYEAGICECGMHKSIADTDPDLDMVKRICPVCADLAKTLRQVADEDKKAVPPNAPPETKRPEDGRYLALKMKASTPEA